MEAKRIDGKMYEPDILSSINKSVQRYLKDRGKLIVFKESPVFRRSQPAAGRKQLKSADYRYHPNATREIEHEE